VVDETGRRKKKKETAGDKNGVREEHCEKTLHLAGRRGEAAPGGEQPENKGMGANVRKKNRPAALVSQTQKVSGGKDDGKG